MELNGLKINFLGDSITEGHGVSRVEYRFTDRLAAAYGIIAMNYGIGGTRIARQKTPSFYPDHDRDFLSRVAELDETADAVLVFGGTNDWGHGDAPLGRMEDRDPFTFYGALHLLCTSLIARFPGKPIIILTPLHRSNESDPNGPFGPRPGTLRDYVQAIREVAEYYSLPVMDLYKESGLQPDVPVILEKYVPDGLHPNDAGHEILARKIAAYLKRY